MKILLMGKWFPPVHGGIETHLADLAGTMSSRHDVTVIVHSRNSTTTEEQMFGARVIRVGTIAEMMSQPISPAMFGAARAIEADVAHVHAPNIWATLAALTLPRKTRIVVTHHADIVGREPVRSVAMLAYHALLRRAERIVVTAPNNFTSSGDLLPLKEKLQVIPYCVRSDQYYGEADIIARGRQLRDGFSKARPLAAFVGRLVPYKGVDVLIDALASAADLHVAIIGDGPQRSNLEAQAKAKGVASRLNFVGNSDEATKHAWLSACDFLVLPSVTVAEAFGIVQVEAMLWGKPVLTTNLPSGVPQVGVDGETSLVVEPRDPAGLARGLERLATDGELRARLGAAGLERARDRYSVERFTETFDALYRSLKP